MAASVIRLNANKTFRRPPRRLVIPKELASRAFHCIKNINCIKSSVCRRLVLRKSLVVNEGNR